MSARSGVSLAECLVALALGSVVCAASASTLASQARLLRAMMAQQQDGEAARVASGVLRDEVRWLDADADVRSIAGDSLAVRLFRGGGVVCAASASELHVSYAGARWPEPDKDSLLVVSPAGVRAVALAGAVAGGTCDAVDPLAGGAVGGALRLTLAGPADGVLVHLFESGVYYVRDGALRYRLGAEGRQPLTDERFATRGPPLRFAGGFTLVPIPWPRAAARPPDTLRVTLLNRP